MVDFTAPWCGPCKIITPIYEKFSNNDLYSNVVFCKVDIEAAHQVGMEFGIKTVRRFLDGFRSDMTYEFLGPNFHVF